MTRPAVAAARPALPGRAARLLLALLLACGVVLTRALLGARPAYAADPTSCGRSTWTTR